MFCAHTYNTHNTHTYTQIETEVQRAREFLIENNLVPKNENDMQKVMKLLLAKSVPLPCISRAIVLEKYNIQSSPRNSLSGSQKEIKLHSPTRESATSHS